MATGTLTLKSYVTKVANHVAIDNGNQLAKLFSIHGKEKAQFIHQPNIQAKVMEACRNRLESPWDDMTINHIKALACLDTGDTVQAYEAQKEVVISFQRIMSTLTRECLPLLYVINDDLREIATMVDEEQPAAAGHRKKLEEAANVISKSFTYCITDRNPLDISKKYGTYHMIGLLFRIYFKLHQQNLCKNILRAVKAAAMPSLDDFPKSDRVTFRYYQGRLHFLEEKYTEAEHELNLAFKECTDAHSKNKELILQTLLPVKLLHGILPTEKLLSKYPKTEKIYGPLARAVRRGDVKAFNEALDAAEPKLVRCGTYFAVERAQSMALRQLFHKVFLIQDCNTRLSIDLFKRALEYVGLETDMEETEGMLATMIYKGYMKGYLSHEKRFVVLSKDNAFPSIASVTRTQ